MSNAAGKPSLIPSDLTWVHELAKAELDPDGMNLFSSANTFDTKQLVEESAVGFLEELRVQFQMFVKVFNGHSDSGQKYSEIKLYNVANTPCDFMLFRNNLKLVVSHSAHGVITVSFIPHMSPSSTVTIDGQKAGQSAAHKMKHDLLVQVGPFLDISWTYQGEKVSPQRLAKYYFLEFVKASRGERKTGLTNQLLLKQIKALLQDKGIDL